MEYCDQRIRTAFLLLASTGMRIGAMHTLKVEDLEKIDKDEKEKYRKEYLTTNRDQKQHKELENTT